MVLLSRTPKVGPMPEMRHHTLMTWEHGHVRAAVLQLNEGTAEIMGVAAAPVHGIGGTNLPDVERWYIGGERALTQAEEMTAHSSSRKVVPDDVTMCIPSEVTRDLPVTVSQRRRNAKRPISLEEMAALLRRGYRTAQDRAQDQGYSASEDIVCGCLTRLTVDGQSVLDPIGLYGEAVEAQLCFFLAPVVWIRALEAVAARLELALTSIVPHHMAYAAPLGEPEALMVLLDEDHSLMALVRNGRIEWTARAPVGAGKMLQGATEDFNLSSPQHIALLMRAYRAGQLREDFEETLARAFWRELRHWMTALAEQAQRAASVQHFPPRLFFFDVPRAVPEARLSLETPFWERCLPFGRCPEVLEMETSNVRNVLDWTSRAGGPAFLLLRSAAHHIARVYAPSHALERLLIEMIHWRRAAAKHPSRRGR